MTHVNLKSSMFQNNLMKRLFLIIPTFFLSRQTFRFEREKRSCNAYYIRKQRDHNYYQLNKTNRY